jgi:hypothetical protein
MVCILALDDAGASPKHVGTVEQGMVNCVDWRMPCAQGDFAFELYAGFTKPLDSQRACGRACLEHATSAILGAYLHERYVSGVDRRIPCSELPGAP